MVSVAQFDIGSEDYPNPVLSRRPGQSVLNGRNQNRRIIQDISGYGNRLALVSIFQRALQTSTFLRNAEFNLVFTSIFGVSNVDGFMVSSVSPSLFQLFN